jgi:hypothetical protein
MKGARSMSCAVLRADCCRPLVALYTSIYISYQDVSVCVHTWGDERGAVDELCSPEGRLLQPFTSAVHQQRPVQGRDEHGGVGVRRLAIIEQHHKEGREGVC